MWLLSTSRYGLKEFNGTEIPPYAILSHCWTDKEILFHEVPIYSDSLEIDHSCAHVLDMNHGKVQCFRSFAKTQGFDWCWIDSCCIDKRSSAELTEAINSMYKYYENAALCAIYLSDVAAFPELGDGHGFSKNIRAPQYQKWLEDIRSSRWFTRGWTLQELLAPKTRMWLAKDWNPIPEVVQDVRWDLMVCVQRMTGITAQALHGKQKLNEFCIAERMSWAARRVTTRPEDGAYSLMGVFGVNMPVLYGEGLHSAFKRLQLEIMKISFDQTIFAWRGPYKSSGLLAHEPGNFMTTHRGLKLWWPGMLSPFSMTNVGLQIRCVLKPSRLVDPNIFLAAFQCDIKTPLGWRSVSVWLQRVPDTACSINGVRYDAYRRIDCQKLGSGDFTGCRVENLLVMEDEQYALVQASHQHHDEGRTRARAT